jgi:uncharacterized membrane protein YfcA
VLAGVALFFTLPFAISALFGDNTRWYLTLLVAPYAIAGVVLGIVWPQMSWQIGIWLFAVWPPALSFDFFLTAEVPSDRKKDLQNLAGYLLILVAACVGGWLGSLTARRLRTSSVHRDAALRGS